MSEKIDPVSMGKTVRPAKPVFFNPDGKWPKLLKVVHSERYGRMELLSVQETSDGFLQGLALIGEGDDAYLHDVFLGSSEDFK